MFTLCEIYLISDLHSKLCDKFIQEINTNPSILNVANALV